MEGHPVISDEVLAKYAADAAVGVAGVTLHGGKPVVASMDASGIRLDVHVSLDWASSAPEAGAALQAQVREYVERMTDTSVESVDVVVDAVAPAPAS